jgi:methylthioribulose-1-phosphate dehydratase
VTLNIRVLEVVPLRWRSPYTQRSFTGRELHSRGWVPATSGNFSQRLDAQTAAMTVSGWHKGRLTEAGLMRVDMEARAVGSDNRPSAEALLHTQIYQRYPEVDAVLHVHSPSATLISRRLPDGVRIAGFELLKAFTGIDTHKAEIHVPVFANDQNIARLARQVEAWWQQGGEAPGYLIAGHGLYTWGRTMQDTLRHLEAFDFLFECMLREQGVPPL